MDFTTKYHLDTYPALSPKRPELSQKGRTVLVTGGAGGVGMGISRAFTEAGVSRLVLMARSPEKMAAAKSELEGLGDPGLDVLTYPCDVTDFAGVQQVWDDLKSKGIGIHVLVLNAAIANTVPQGLAEENFTLKIWTTFETNVRSSLQMTDIFLKQGPAKGKAIISISSGGAHIAPSRPAQIGYTSSKAGLASLMQSIADVVDPEETQIISMAPGSVKSEAVIKAGMANAPIAWNSDALPGAFSVWASTEEARFLHGRFVWCNWDVDELKAMSGFKHPGFCRIGLQGPKPLSAQELFAQMTERRKSST